MFDRELEAAVKAASLAGDYLRSCDNIHAEKQVGRDIKLVADKESERVILSVLTDTGIPVLSEECGFVGEEGEFLWLVDPIDGTLNYFRGLTEFSCVSIALWEKGRPRLGVINRFSTNEMFHGVLGMGAFLNGKPINTSDTERMSDAIIATGFPVARDYSTESLIPFVQMVQNFKKVRMLGSAAIMGVLVASGIVDAYVEEDIMFWDVAAAIAIAEAAGAKAVYEPRVNNKCFCSLFATEELCEDYMRGKN